MPPIGRPLTKNSIGGDCVKINQFNRNRQVMHFEIYFTYKQTYRVIYNYLNNRLELVKVTAFDAQSLSISQASVLTPKIPSHN
jgi:hypothetical protein